MEGIHLCLGITLDLELGQEMVRNCNQRIFRPWLNAVEGSLVDDEELINVLQETKTTASEVGKKLQVAAETEKKINSAREEFRGVATRGSILYFLIVELSKVNVMYQTALRQFLVLFDISVTKSKPTHVVEKRIGNILDFLTKSVWKYTNR